MYMYQVCDQIWARCTEKRQYQASSVRLLNQVQNMDRGWERFDDSPSTLPRTTTEWKIVDERECWEEYASFEKIMRGRAAKEIENN